MNILVINCGSSSLKYQVINSDTEAVLAKGLCERIGLDGRLVYQKAGGEKEITDADMPTHKQAIQMVLDALVNPKTGALKSLEEIGAVGHRVVHGGEKFASSTILNEEVLKVIEECNELAPLHNPANLIGIRACQELMPNVSMVGVFDKAFPSLKRRICTVLTMITMRSIKCADMVSTVLPTVMFPSVRLRLSASPMRSLRRLSAIWEMELPSVQLKMENPLILLWVSLLWRG